MKQYRIKRQIAVVPVVAGGQVTVDLPRGYDYESIMLRIHGTLNVTGAAGAVRPEAPCQVVPRIELHADGKNVLFNAPFWYASFGNVHRAMIAAGGRVTVPPTGAGIAAYAVEAIGYIDFQIPDGVHPKDSNFRTSGLALWQLKMQFGNAIDCFSGGGAADYVGGMWVDVCAAETVEGVDPVTKQFSSPIALKKVSYQEIAVLASSTNMETRLPAGNLIRQVTVRTEGVAVAGDPGIGILNRLTLKNGVDVRFDMQAGNLRCENNAQWGQVLAGYYVADLMDRGPSAAYLTDAWDVTGSSEPKVVMDVTGGAAFRAQIVTEEYIIAKTATPQKAASPPVKR